MACGLWGARAQRHEKDAGACIDDGGLAASGAVAVETIAPVSRTLVTASGQLTGVQALRGIAALLVVFVHYNGTAQSKGFAIGVLEGAAVSGIGVDIFFVISGFIMELTAGGRTHLAGDATTFLARRAARVLPLYWVLTVLGYAATVAFASAVNSSFTFGQFVMSMLLLPSTRPDGNATYVISVAWSLTYELYFYVLFAALLRFGTGRRLSTMAGLFALSVLVGLIAQPHTPLARYLVDPILFEFLSGCLLADWYRRGRTLAGSEAWLLGAAAACAMALEFHFVVPAAFRIIFWGIPSFALVASVVLSTNAVPKLIEAPFVYLGNISYSLYLSHYFTVAVFARLQNKWSATLLSSEWVCALVFIGLCLFVAHLCYVLIETPSRLVLSQVTHRRMAAALRIARAGDSGAARPSGR